MPGGQPCSRSDTEKVKHLNCNIKYLNDNLVCIFFQNYALNILGGGMRREKNYIVLLGKKCVLEMVTYLTIYLLLEYPFPQKEWWSKLVSSFPLKIF